MMLPAMPPAARRFLEQTGQFSLATAAGTDDVFKVSPPHS